MAEKHDISWHVATFSRERGSGTLVRGADEPIAFSIDAWDLGDWKPPKRAVYFAVDGSSASSPDDVLLPRPGEPVRVEWKRSRTGQTVPARVQPTGRVSALTKSYKLGAWIAGIQKHAGRFVGVTTSELLAAIDEDATWGDGEPRDGSEFVELLMALADAKPSWAAWIYADDHRWDRERAQRVLGPTCAPSGDDESLPDYAARCNAAAAASVRWHELAFDGDAHVLIAVTDDQLKALVDGGYVAVD